jgi:hypothetical protein
MLIFKDSGGVASAKIELFIGRRIIMQGLAHSHTRGNKKSTKENALLFPF